MNDYRVTVKVRNNHILKAIEMCGGSAGPKWCSAKGLCYTDTNNLINMIDSPLNSDGLLRNAAKKLCDVLNKLPEELWSNEQLYPLERNFSEMEMSYEQVVSMLPQEQRYYQLDTTKVENEQARNLVDNMPNTLALREKRVIQMRYTDDMTFSECAKSMNLTAERVRQIEAKALRKLRHPARVGMIVDLLDVDEDRRNNYKAETVKHFGETPCQNISNQQHERLRRL